MTRNYLTPAQAVAHFTARAADCDRKGLPRLADDYRRLAANARVSRVIDDGAMKQREGQ